MIISNLQPYHLIYKDMLDNIRHCQRKKLDKLQEIEYCFQVAANYWARLVQGGTPEFSSVADTVSFYTRLQPAFLAEILYYELCYYAIMFHPTERIQDLKHFLVREASRKDRYIE